MMTTSPRRPRRPALRYFGGKWKIATWIMTHFPPAGSYDTYVEPFGGAMSVLLRKAPAPIEVYNDLYHDVVDFFRVLREQPAELIAAIDMTPVSREEYRRAHHIPSEADALERARCLYIRSWQGRGRVGHPGEEHGGWRYCRHMTRSKTIVDDWINNGHLWTVARRLRQVSLECDTALNVIQRYDTPRTLFYLDPPYPTSTRCPRHTSAYQHELTDHDHHELAQALASIEGMAIVSTYPSPLYTDLYAGWDSDTYRTRNDRLDHRTEMIYISPHTQAQRLPLLHLHLEA